MADRSIFDNLVAELSTTERRDLLQRLKSSAAVSTEPLYGPSSLPRTAHPDSAVRIAELGVLSRLVLFLKSVFTGKSREEILREEDLREIGRRVESRFPELLDRRRDLLLEGMADEIRRLRDSARFFYEVLDRSVEKDKAAFFAFLGSIELPETHARLLSDCDPFALAERAPSSAESEVRSSVMDAYERAVDELDERGRRAMYHDLRSLLFLKRLSGFLFERILGSFREGAGPGGSAAATFAETRELFIALGDILFSMAQAPTIELMEALFVFLERDEIARPESDAESVIGADLAKAESALGRIRSFNGRLPFADILRIVTGDPAYAPSELPGGEDWLVIYKSFWWERIENRLQQWKAERRYRELAEEIAAFVGEPGPAGFAHISREQSESSPPVRQEMSLRFLDAFFRGPFLRELNRPLKLLLVEGEFYRKDNRVEFTDAYDCLARLPESLAGLDARLGPAGETGATWIAAKSEMGPAQVKRRKVQAIARGAEEDAERLVRAAGEALGSLVCVIRGVLKGEAGGRYDSLSNLSFMDGKANKEYLRSLDQSKDRCEKARSFLAELSGLDLGPVD